jgi:integrase
MLLKETGIRRGELLGLHLEDVQDMDVNARICIKRRRNPNNACAKGKERIVPILHNRKAVQETFQTYLLQEYPLEGERLGHGMLFVTLEGETVGQPMTIERLNALFKQLKDRTGIKAHPHLFRHTFATRMLQAGYMDGYVQQLLGHRSIATTKDIYSHVLEEMELGNLLEDSNDSSNH